VRHTDTEGQSEEEVGSGEGSLGLDMEREIAE
jgi:hypothetical protein